MMWFAPTWKMVKDAWPAFALMAAVFVVLAVAIAFMMSRCSSKPGPPDHLDGAMNIVMDQLKADKEKNEKRLTELRSELDALMFKVDILDEEIAESAKQREELHDAIDNAVTIDDIDRALSSGARAGRGRR